MVQLNFQYKCIESFWIITRKELQEPQIFRNHGRNNNLTRKAMSSDIIRFSYNWNNKLENKAFTTLRIHNPKKYILGNAYQIELEGKIKGMAVLHSKRILSVEQLNDFICYLDTGYNRTEAKNILQRMYKSINLETALFDFCLLVYQTPLKREVKALQTMLLLW